jgi:hypothetical protein
MPRVGDLLDRFRPAGTPGPAAAAGVPADRRAAAAEEELAPVFTALADVERECTALHDAALAATRKRTEQAAHEAAALTGGPPGVRRRSRIAELIAAA